MKLLTALLATLVVSSAWADTYVRPYVRSDGTYVEGHMKSDANSTRSDNYSSRGNTNPYTGERGSVRDEPRYPSIYTPQSSTPNPFDSEPRQHRRRY